jgi:hypothetical protein
VGAAKTQSGQAYDPPKTEKKQVNTREIVFSTDVSTPVETAAGGGLRGEGDVWEIGEGTGPTISRAGA